MNRILQSLFVLFAVLVLSFSLRQFVGDPVRLMVPEQDTGEYETRLREQLGLDDPMPRQFGRFVGDALRGDFGTSYSARRPVRDLIKERLPATVELVGASAIVAMLMGVAMGVFAAIHHRRASAELVRAVSLLGISVPTFVTGILLILIFSVQLRWLPAFGRGDVVEIGVWTTGFLTISGLKALVLPTLTLAVYQAGLIMRLVESGMLEAFSSAHVLAARGRGIPERTIRYRYALRSAAIPFISAISLQVGSLIAFSLVTETVFNWPGMGLLFVQAIQFADFPLLTAYLVLVAVLFVLLALAADALSFIVDPRLRVGTVSPEGRRNDRPD